jgi:LPS export ABC transporter protein LptC
MRFRTRLLVTAMLIGLALAGCGKNNSDEVAGGTSEMPDEVITSFVTEESDSGRVRWRLSAPQASKFEKKRVFLMTRPKIEFYDELGNLQSTLTSNWGEYFDTSRDMLAYGDVVVVTVEGDVLETDSLRYLNAEDRIVNECFNKLTRGNDVLTGYGLECDHNLSSVNIKRDVEANIIDAKGNIIEN